MSDAYEIVSEKFKHGLLINASESLIYAQRHIEAEREACAKIADNCGMQPGGYLELPRRSIDIPKAVSSRIAAAIRARGTP